MHEDYLMINIKANKMVTYTLKKLSSLQQEREKSSKNAKQMLNYRVLNVF